MDNNLFYIHIWDIIGKKGVDLVDSALGRKHLRKTKNFEIFFGYTCLPAGNVHTGELTMTLPSPSNYKG